jgi:hypothetical protein
MIPPASRLPGLVRDGREASVPLIPNSGLQFLDIPLDLGKLEFERAWFDLPRESGFAALREARRTEDGRNWRAVGEGQQIFDARDPALFRPALEEALLPFLEEWIPIPYLLRQADGPPELRRLDHGPQNWARLRIVQLAEKEPEGYTHRAVLAFDTATQDPARRDFLAPRAGERGIFVLGCTLREIAWLLAGRPGADGVPKPSWLANWVEELYRRRDHTGQPLDPREPIGNRHLACYLTLLGALGASGMMPRVELVDLRTAEATPGGYIDVDLVLDLGNSRSCGFLVERAQGRPALSDGYRLALRDLSAPEHVWDEPFPSRLEFANHRFGNDDHSLDAGSDDAFYWPSPVRIGAEAARLSALSIGAEGQTGLSSPKRYVWDERERLTPWRPNPTTSDGLGQLIGHYLNHLTPDGRPLSQVPGGVSAVRALFSRASLFSLFLLEVLLQARSQINSYAARYGRQDIAAPRRLASVILTVPPALPVEELKLVRERAAQAVQLLSDVTGGIGARPRSGLPGAAERGSGFIPVEAKLDEATATQIVHLFDQISHVHRGDAPLFLDLVGRPRAVAAGAAPVPSARIGSIDVGGGTTDLAIHTFTLEDNVVVPREDFREGFRVAGDDVLEQAVMRHVLPAVVAALVAAGAAEDRARAFLISNFQVPASNEPERQSRRLVLGHLLAPAALGLLARYEGWTPLASAGVGAERLAALLGDSRAQLSVRPVAGTKAAGPRQRAAAWFDERAARETGARGFRLLDVAIPVDLAALHETVRQTLREPLEPLCEIVHRHRCDTLLLSGRGARWPAVTEIVLGSLCIEPDRVVPMHRHPVGAWYPHADGCGRISDPKTTVAVGALLHRLLRGGQLDNLAMRDKFGARSTARYIGVMSDGRIPRERVLFEGVDLDAAPGSDPVVKELRVPGSCFLGFRQFAAPRWPATPLYRLAFASADAAGGVTPPVSLAIRRKLPRARKDDPDPVAEFEIVRGSQVDAAGVRLAREPIVLSLQTLAAEEGSHWQDSGQLELLDKVLPAARMG